MLLPIAMYNLICFAYTDSMEYTTEFAVTKKEDLPSEGFLLLFSEDESFVAGRDLPEEILSWDEPDTEKLFMPLSSLEVRELTAPLSFLISRVERNGEIIPLYCSGGGGNVSLPTGYSWISFSGIFRRMRKEFQFPLSRGRQILTWERTHRYCGTCGGRTEPVDHEPCRKCTSCGAMFYPRFSPAIIVRITRGRRIMLAHNGRFPGNMYSHIAGFVEAGESLEDAVRREIREEVSLEVENIRYFDSQQWPMPHSLMLGFTAECPEGEPVPDGEEITDARWFDPEHLPDLPQPGSIARRMLDDYLEN